MDLGRSVRKLYWGSSEIGFSHSSNVNTVGDTDGALPCPCANSCAYSRVVGRVCQRLSDWSSICGPGTGTSAPMEKV